MQNIRVLITDDHPIVCKGIRELLESVAGIHVVGEAYGGRQALEMVSSLNPDVLLLDIQMPDLNGVEVLNRIVKSGSRVRVLVLSSYDDREYISQMLSLGAAGYLIKDEVPSAIIDAVQGVARGEKGWVSHKVAAKLSQMLDSKAENANELTARELEVLRLVAQGNTNSEIGLKLGISEKTVEKHLDTMFKKMGVVSRVEAAVVAVRQQLI